MSIVVFPIVSLLHLLRYFLGWEIITNAVIIPVWISAPALVIAGRLAFMVWREMNL